jgi:hypothetical protein
MQKPISTLGSFPKVLPIELKYQSISSDEENINKWYYTSNTKFTRYLHKF